MASLNGKFAFANVARRFFVLLKFKASLAAGSFCEALSAPNKKRHAVAYRLLFGAGKRTLPFTKLPPLEPDGDVTLVKGG